ncbi:MAG: hypothetical protein SVW57_05670 [Thermodesulfobacteriota bacterium]|nr:hypothetical protein [Thermodesulfobacteriota bacterium]
MIKLFGSKCFQWGMFFALVICFYMGVSSCSLLNQGQSQPEGMDEPMQGSVEAIMSKYQFKDVHMPPRLTLVGKESFVIETQNSKSGILIYEGNVDPISLIDFFKDRMMQDGWELINIFRFKENILNFKKSDRICTIRIKESVFKTRVEVNLGAL